MQPNIPLPTDNLYKFMALFGLVLVVSSIFGAVLTSRSANNQIFEAAKEHYQLGAEQLPDREAYANTLAKKATIAAEDRRFFAFFIGLILTAGIALSARGFYIWKQFQPYHDELLRLQVEKARKEAGLPPFSSGPIPFHSSASAIEVATSASALAATSAANAAASAAAAAASASEAVNAMQAAAQPASPAP